MMHKILLKRVYDGPFNESGSLILVDRLWPRGISKNTIGDFFWAKDIAPSVSIRKAFHHHEISFEAFSANYRDELRRNPCSSDFLNFVREQLAQSDITLLFGSRDAVHNQAAVLKEWLEENLGAS